MSTRFLPILACLLLVACGGDGDADSGDSVPAAAIPNELSGVCCEYDLTFEIQLGWMKDGETRSFTRPGSLTVRPSEPGVINVPEGTTLPGVSPEDVMFGAAYVQNPVSVSFGTTGFDTHGDFGIFTMVRYGIPIGGPYIFAYDGCDAVADGKGPFECVPHFYGATETSGSVNLVYFSNRAMMGADGLVYLSGYLADDHTAEASAANQAFVHFTHDTYGEMNDIFIFYKGAEYSLTIDGTQVSGSFAGVARSASGMVYEDLAVTATFTGTRGD